MANLNLQTLTIRDFICENIGLGSANLSNLVVKTFSISRQAVNSHIKNLVVNQVLTAKKKGKSVQYILKPIFKNSFREKIGVESTENTVREKTIDPIFQKLKLPKNVYDSWMYGFSEMVNNLIDHSGSKSADISIQSNYLYTEIIIQDNGIGIFKKIENFFKLKEAPFILLELFKGKLTSDPSRHSGEGFFFTSRIFDYFQISSGMYSFSKERELDIWKIVLAKRKVKGTKIILRFKNRSDLEINDIFMKYVVGDDFKFSKTDIRIELAEFQDEFLVSRSQAKRILYRLENFTEVVFDFKNVENIGPAFADELFRVSKIRYPELKIRYSNVSQMVEIFIKKALSATI